MTDEKVRVVIEVTKRVDIYDIDVKVKLSGPVSSSIADKKRDVLTATMLGAVSIFKKTGCSRELFCEILGELVDMHVDTVDIETEDADSLAHQMMALFFPPGQMN